jgi:NADH:ubiquinone oxidoreductase subunit F (NADH-binding)
MGYNLKKMIYEVGGGIPGGRDLKAVVPGGSSTPVLLPSEIDVAMDFDSVGKTGSMLGSGGVVVLDDTTCIVKFALRTMKFYRHESCGWCIPCREGTDWLEEDFDAIPCGRWVEERYRQHLLPGGEHVGEDFLSAGGRGGDADDGVREKVQTGIRSSPGWKAVPV